MAFTNYPLPVEEINRRMEKELEYSRYLNKTFSNTGEFNSNYVHPATKEQRDTLEKAMADAGYTFDFDKKELKKIEQNPACGGEDEKIRQFLIHEVTETSDEIMSYRNMNKKDVLAWLESLKDRILPQPKQEWSDEDEEMYKEVLTDIIYAKNDLKAKGCHGLSKSAMKAFNWFNNRYKSLRPQSQWKPSKEQMIAINTAINVIGKGTLNGKQLIELQEQLKKLRED